MSLIGSTSLYPITNSSTGNMTVSTRISTTGGSDIIPMTSNTYHYPYSTSLGLGSSYYSDLSMYNALADTGQQAQGMGVEDGDILSSSNAVYEPMVQGSLGYNTTQTATNPWAWGVTDWISAGMMGVGLGFGSYNMAKNTETQIFDATTKTKLGMAKLFGADTTKYQEAIDEKTKAEELYEKETKKWTNSQAKDAKKQIKKAKAEVNQRGKTLDNTIDTQLADNISEFQAADDNAVSANFGKGQVKIDLDEKGRRKFDEITNKLKNKQLTDAQREKLNTKKSDLLKKYAEKQVKASTNAPSKGALFKQSWKGGLASNICMNVLNVGVTGFTEYQQTGEIGKQTTKALVTGIVNTLATTTLTAACSIIPGGPVVAAIVGTVAGGAITTGINKLSSWICSKIPGWSDEEIAQENAEKAAKKNGTYVDPSQAQAQPQASGPAVITSSQLEAQLSQMTSDEQATFMAQLQEAIQAGQIVLQ